MRRHISLRALWCIGVIVLGCGRGVHDAKAADLPALNAGASEFQVTVFADRLSFPTSMQQLAPGYLLVATTANPSGKPGANFYGNAVGQLIVLHDADGDGTAEQRKIVADNLPGTLCSVRLAGNLILTTNQGSQARIHIFRRGAGPMDPLTPLGSLNVRFPAHPETGRSYQHSSYALAVRPTPDAMGKYDVFFNVGSQYNNKPATQPTVVLTASGLVRFDGGAMQGASIYKVTLEDVPGTAGVAVTDLTQIASGLRCAAGIAIDPRTGDLWFQDNGIDDTTDPHANFSADELNRIPFGDIGGAVEDFGFPESYVRSRDGAVVGTATHDVAFQPIGGGESEGASEIAFAPPGFPPGFRGIFVGFHGKWSAKGVANEENPVVHYDPATRAYVHFIDVRQEMIAHPNGLLATEDSLFIADMGEFMGKFDTGTIYRVQAVR